MAGVDAAYSEGILLGGGVRTMGALSKATHAVVHKTGTLTKGSLDVMGYQAEDAHVHPVAKAVFKWALTMSYTSRMTHFPRHMDKMRNLRSTPVKGKSCEGQTSANIWTKASIGSATYLNENGIKVPNDSTPASKVYFAFDGQYSDYICVQDTIRPEASSIIKSLLSNGLQVTMLTGDVDSEAARISSLLNIPVLASRTSPFDKMRHVQDLQQQGHHVAMVGDGVNDILAQSTADVGVSISLTQGCLARAESVVILSGGSHRLATAFIISRRVVAQARMNVRWALVYNAVALSLAVSALGAGALLLRL
ncbi:hypothetical protein G6011_06874 [Alternaria panax]|uniref:Uncharacterized protein n=1 Tax=Alternaria panax TaxID=48097 RepID=A0AAD4F8Y7_9PLEO|nr:hypothetical protein G6011_06874 [Alternaria panax]